MNISKVIERYYNLLGIWIADALYNTIRHRNQIYMWLVPYRTPTELLVNCTVLAYSVKLKHKN